MGKNSHRRAVRRFVSGLTGGLLAIIGATVTAGPATADDGPTVTPYIVGGATVDIAQAPWMVAVYEKVGTGYAFRCGGVLVSPNHVATAAHCVELRTAGDLKVVANRTNLQEDGGDERFVTKKWEQSAYSNVGDGSYVNDLVLLSLHKPLSITPLSIASSSAVYTPGTMGTIYGWGGTYASDPDGSAALRSAQVPMVADSTCTTQYKPNSTKPGISLDMTTAVCAGDIASGNTFCSGDEGGPLVVGGTLVGIASFNPGCSNSIGYGVYTRMTAFKTEVKNETRVQSQDDLSGDGVADLAAVWTDGSLHAYLGDGRGGLIDPEDPEKSLLWGGKSWLTTKHLVKGDFTNDGVADFMSVWGDGTLHHYRGKGDGTIVAGQTAVAVGGSTWDGVKHLTAGDFTGDAIADLMAVWADGTLHLYRGRGDGTIDQQVPIALGGNTWGTTKGLTAGDYNGDGVADLMAIWTDDTLHYYQGRNDGTLAAQVPVTVGGSTWGTVLHLTSGDYNGDGYADLMAIWSNGTLHSYAGKGNGQINPQTAITLGGDTWKTTRQLA
ncbi:MULTISPECIES: trypsin-like serine protease [unclassified Streptomyces]|uniref:trypsin-like serine protease n=1 Tax=unclassified Streptomyces TaxID=2593676 RepID=UPI0033B8D397